MNALRSNAQTLHVQVPNQVAQSPRYAQAGGLKVFEHSKTRLGRLARGDRLNDPLVLVGGARVMLGRLLEIDGVLLTPDDTDLDGD